MDCDDIRQKNCTIESWQMQTGPCRYELTIAPRFPEKRSPSTVEKRCVSPRRAASCVSTSTASTCIITKSACRSVKRVRKDFVFDRGIWFSARRHAAGR